VDGVHSSPLLRLYSKFFSITRCHFKLAPPWPPQGVWLRLWPAGGALFTIRHLITFWRKKIARFGITVVGSIQICAAYVLACCAPDRSWCVIIVSSSFLANDLFECLLLFFLLFLLRDMWLNQRYLFLLS